MLTHEGTAPDTAGVSPSPCTQVSVESPEVLVPLLSGITNAWIWTIDHRMGLFNGTTSAAAATAAAASSAAGGHGDGRGEVVDMLADDHGAEDGSSHDDAMLQVRGAMLQSAAMPAAEWQRACEGLPRATSLPCVRPRLTGTCTSIAMDISQFTAVKIYVSTLLNPLSVYS